MIPIKMGVLSCAVICFSITPVMLSCNNPGDAVTETSGKITDTLLAPDTTVPDSGLLKTWTFASHDKDADPDYATVFPDDAVNRIDVIVSDSAWNIMVADMASMAGTFGAGGGMGAGGMPGGGDTGMVGGMPGAGGDTGMAGGMPGGGGDTGMAGGIPGGGGSGVFPGGELPQEFIDAAVGKQMGEECSCTMMGMELTGTVDTSGGQLYCNPSMPDGGQGGGGGDGGGMSGGGAVIANTEFLPREPVYVPATVLFGEKQWSMVGFRFKGNSSLSSAWGEGVYKLPFRIKTDEFEDEYPEIKNQRMYGFHNLSLCNNYMDNSFIHEKIAGELFRAFGVPASRSTFVRLYITIGGAQPVYFGLYTMDEVPEEPLLETWFDNHKGNLYKPEGTGATFGTYDASSFEEKNNNDVANEDIRELFDVLHGDRSDAAAWRKKLEKKFDVPVFLKWLAVNTVIGNWDAYGSMPHNYYLYNNDGRLTWIAWDLGLSFSEGSGMGGLTGGSGQATDIEATITHAQIDSTWPLIRFLLDDPIYFAEYMGYVGTFTATEFTTDILTAKAQAAHALIAPYVTGMEPEVTGYTYLSSAADFETAQTSLVQFIGTRYAAVTALLTTPEMGN